MQKFLEVAKKAALAAKEIICDAYERDYKIELKSDYTPVTEIDVAVEKKIKEIILSEFRDHGFYGEETGRSDSDSDYLWLIDPIDGTKAFIRKRPFFSCQIALMYKGEIIVAVSMAPAFDGGEMAYAMKNHGAYINDHKLTVSDISSLKDAVFSSGNIKSLAKDEKAWQKYGELLQAINTTRGFGDFLHYHYLASGKLDIVVESDVNILDVAALSLLVQEAGGKVTDFSGKPLGLDSRNIIATNHLLHKDVLSFIQKS